VQPDWIPDEDDGRPHPPATAPWPGNVQFKNIQLTGTPGEYRIQLEGADEQHRVTGVSFEGVSILGKGVEKGSPHLQIGKLVDDVRFDPKQ
jgi:hypothetical protein